MTIYALSSGPGISGVAVIRISGEEKAKEFSDKKKLVNTRNIVFDNLLKSPLFDVKKFSKEFLGSLEAIYNK